MKRSVVIVITVLFATVCCWAVPYASLMRVSLKSTGVGAGLTITYQLNEAADSVNISIIKNAGGTTAATFPGATNQTTNTVVWDGTVNNAHGAAVGAGDYYVRIEANKNISGGWREIASNRSVGNYSPPAALNTIFMGYSGKDLIITQRTESDAFGMIIGSSSYIGGGTDGPNHAACIVFNPDTSILFGGDGFDSRVLRAPRDYLGTASSQDVWGVSFDPDNPEAVFICGQAGGGADPGLTGLMYGTPLTSESLVDADPLDINSANLPRLVAVAKEGSQKFAYFSQGSSTVYKVEVDANNQLTGTGNNIMSLAVATRYSKEVVFDGSGNLYWSSRRDGTNGELNGAVYRWNNSQILGNPPATPLTEDNAVWAIQAGPNMSSLLGVAITPSGDAYTAFAAGAESGIYYIGNVSTPTISKILTVADRVVDFTTIGGTGWVTSGFGGCLRPDIAGNIYVTDNSTEQLRAFSPPGVTTKIINAPSSQLFTITSGIQGWPMY
ncbi:MAG: FlgD immunoglobulin-like domain containing protein [bacterium]|nr:hypothetical protein [Candidatus Sumerlaeota bacterium]